MDCPLSRELLEKKREWKVDYNGQTDESRIFRYLDEDERNFSRL